MRRKKIFPRLSISHRQRDARKEGTGHVTGASCPQCPQLTEKAGPPTVTGLFELNTARAMWGAMGLALIPI